MATTTPVPDYDCIVIGAGPSAEPVIHHLKSTKLKVLVLSGTANLQKRPNSSRALTKGRLCNSVKLSPKQNQPGVCRVDQATVYERVNDLVLTSENFSYAFASGLGGLSNFWAGGAVRWTQSEIADTTGLDFDQIYKAYSILDKRLGIGSIESTSLCAISEDTLRNSSSWLTFQRPLFYNSNKRRTACKLLPDYDQQFVWSSSETILGYIDQSDNFTLKHLSARALEQLDDLWHVTCMHGDKTEMFSCRNVFLCAGTVFTAMLVYSALKSQGLISGPISTRVSHNHTALLPLLGPKLELTYLAPQLPEFHWDLQSLCSPCPEASGYLFSSQVLIVSLLSGRLTKPLRLCLSPILKYLYIVTIFFPSAQSEAMITYDEDSGRTMRIHISSGKLSLRQKNLQSSAIKKFLKGTSSIFRSFFGFFMRGLAGSDIHYACTVPYLKASLDGVSYRPKMHTDELGRVSGLKSIYVCDPSRLAYLSSKPHTYTSMAITEASMPSIMKEIGGL
jgi:hypothetical protein